MKKINKMRNNNSANESSDSDSESIASSEFE